LPARTQPRVGDPDLNDRQILLLEVAHGMLVDTETYIDCPYRYWPVAQVPGRRSLRAHHRADRKCERGARRRVALRHGVVLATSSLP
jgi:hypothetical protein